MIGLALPAAHDHSSRGGAVVMWIARPAEGALMTIWLPLPAAYDSGPRVVPS